MNNREEKKYKIVHAIIQKRLRLISNLLILWHNYLIYRGKFITEIIDIDIN